MADKSAQLAATNRRIFLISVVGVLLIVLAGAGAMLLEMQMPIDRRLVLAVPLLAAAGSLFCASRQRVGQSAALAATACALVFSNFTLGVVLTAFPQIKGEGEADKAKDVAKRNICFDSRIYAGLAGEPRGRVLNTRPSSRPLPGRASTLFARWRLSGMPPDRWSIFG